MTLSRQRLDFLTLQVYRALKDSPAVTVLDADRAVALVRTAIAENVRIEQELEREAEKVLAPHLERILREGADYRRMVRDGMKTLARKRGFVL